MATNEQLIPIPGRLHSLAPEGHVAGADEIYDDDLQKSQSDINADVKVMGASGENHSKGLVPDPGATQGTSKYLREDGTWAQPDGQNYIAGDGINITSNAISVKAGTNLSIDSSGNLNATDTTYSTMGASGSTHSSGLVPDTPSTAGTTKFLREDATWQEVSASPEVQIGGNTPSSDSEIKLFVDESADDTVEVYTKAQADGQFMVIVNSNSAPASSTLTYTSTDGTTKNFKVGDEVRVPDAEADNGYTFYKLYALTTESSVTTATWDKLGAGGGSSDWKGTIIVNLEAYEGTNEISQDFAGVEVTLTNTTDSEVVEVKTLISGNTSVTFSGLTPLKDYTISVSNIIGYYDINDQYVYNMDIDAIVIKTFRYNTARFAYVTIDQTQSSELSKITVTGELGGTAQVLNQSTGKHENVALQQLRDSSHLYLGTFANSKMTLKQLKDNDGTKYLDGTTASMDGTQGDHFLRIGIPFYIKRVSGSNSGNQVTYGICIGSQPDSTWKQIITPNDLLGVHEAYLSNNNFYSRSGVQSSSDFYRSNALTYAHNRGTGFTLVTWEWHCVMALLFYAWYGRTDVRSQCGSGANSYTRTLGTKDSMGMTDTTSSTGNTDNTKFWGIENWWGDKVEYMENVTGNNYVYTITNARTGASRTVQSCSKGYIKTLALTEELDMVPTAVGATATTYYCDYHDAENGSVNVLRSGLNAGGGVLCSFCSNESYKYLHMTSRLAFYGTVEISE